MKTDTRLRQLGQFNIQPKTRENIRKQAVGGQRKCLEIQIETLLYHETSS